MGISDYVKNAEARGKEYISICYLANRLDEIGQSVENEYPHTTHLDHARVLRKEIQAYVDREIQKTHKQWENYLKAYKDWESKYGGITSMEAGMNEPNKPNYTRANND